MQIYIYIYRQTTIVPNPGGWESNDYIVGVLMRVSRSPLMRRLRSAASTARLGVFLMIDEVFEGTNHIVPYQTATTSNKSNVDIWLLNFIPKMIYASDRYISIST